MAYMNILKFHSVQLPPMNAKIVVTNPEKTFTSGDTITGEFFLSCQKNIYSFGLKLALEGRGMVKFKDQGNQTKSIVLFETSTYVYGEQRVRLQPGDHGFPFALELPAHLPVAGSFRSPFGLVLYQIVAYVQLEWKSVRKSEKTLNIGSYLNLPPDSSSPVCYEKGEKSLLHSLMSRRQCPHFRFNFRLSQSGFLPGEEVPFELELENPAALDILSLSAALVQKVTYSAGSASKVKQKVVARVMTSSTDTEIGTVWTGAISIPQGTPPNQKGIIEISYAIKIEVKPGSQALTLKGEVPVTIGTTRDSHVTSPTLEKTRAECPKSEVAALLEVKCSKGRDRSPSPCRLAGTKSGRSFHKSLDRPESCRMPRRTHPDPPRYSVLSVRSSSVETLPPTYEDVVKEDSSPEILETSEFIKFAEEDAEEELVDDFDEDDGNNVDKIDEAVPNLTISDKTDGDISSKL